MHRAGPKSRREQTMEFKFFKFRSGAQITIEKIKKMYRELAMEFHPDRGGDEEAMKVINAEFDSLRKRYYNVHESSTGNVYTDESQDTVDSVTEKFEDIIEVLINMDGIDIEICGSFVWVSGDTYPHKDTLKGMGFRWARSKKRWYLAPEGWKKTGSSMSMSQIRNRYGSQKVEANKKPQFKLIEA